MRIEKRVLSGTIMIGQLKTLRKSYLDLLRNLQFETYRSTRGDASIGTVAVVDTCGYTPPTRTFLRNIESGQREVECCWER